MVRDRYATQRKTVRNEALYDYAEQHPEVTFEGIGRIYNITKQRVSEIIANERKRRATESERTPVA